jgi:hypothetical protein
MEGNRSYRRLGVFAGRRSRCVGTAVVKRINLRVSGTAPVDLAGAAVN